MLCEMIPFHEFCFTLKVFPCKLSVFFGQGFGQGTFMASRVEHMLEKSPLRRQVVRCASALNPNLMADKDEQEACVVKFSALVTKLSQLKHIDDKVGNKAIEEYKNVLDEVVTLSCTGTCRQTIDLIMFSWCVR